MGSQKRLMESTFCFQQQKLHTRELYLQNVTPATGNLVVHVTIIEENRTQKTVLNYCAQAKAMLKCVQNGGLSNEKLH